MMSGPGDPTLTRGFTGGFGRFMSLVAWELRLHRMRASWFAASLVVGFGMMVALWWAARLPPDSTGTFQVVASLLTDLLIATPIRDQVVDEGQLTFAYTFLRYIVYAMLGLAHLVLPALAAGTVGSDRTSGRLQELQLTLYSARVIYLAKSVAPSLLFLIPGAAITLAFLPIMVSELMPLAEVIRLGTEVVTGVLMTAAVSVACSALCRSPWTARFLAYFLVIIVLPVGWTASLWFLGKHDVELLIRGYFIFDFQVNPGFSTACLAQLLFVLALSAVAYLIGVTKLHIHGPRQALADEFSAVARWIWKPLSCLRRSVQEEA